MKKLVLSTVLFAAFAQLATGCIIVSDSDDEGNFEVTWTLRSSDITVPDNPEVEVFCPAGLTAKVLVREGGTLIGEELFDCDVGRGTTGVYVVGNYELEVEVVDDANQLLAASAPIATSLVADGDLARADFNFYYDRGELDLQWDIVDGALASDCATVGGDDVQVESLLIADNDTYVDLYTCADGGGRTQPLPLGSYAIDVFLYDTNDPNPINLSPISLSADLTYGNQLVLLDPFSIDAVPAVGLP